MKLSLREMLMIILLALAAWGYVSYSFIVTPAEEALVAAQSRYDNAVSRERAARTKLATLADLTAREEAEAKRGLQAAEAYFPDYLEEKIVAFVHGLAGRSGLTAMVISANGVVLRDLDQLAETAKQAEQDYLTGQIAKAIADAEAENEAGEAPPPPKAASSVIGNAAYAYSLQIEFAATTYRQITDFFRGFEALSLLAAIDNVTMQADLEGVLKGSFVVNLMAIDSIAPRPSAFPDVDLPTPAGKADPFAGQ